jgi:hypothetical protein
VPATSEARSPPLTPWSRAQAPAQQVAPTRGRSDGRERRLGLAPASPCRAPPHSVVLAAAPTRARPGPSDLARMAQIRYPFVLKGAVHRGPVHRVHGAVHGARTRRQPLDLRSTVRLRPFSLRAPELLNFSKPVLPPLRIFTVRSWFLRSSPCLPWLIVLKVLFTPFCT